MRILLLKLSLIALLCAASFRASGQLIKTANYCSCQRDTTHSAAEVRWFRVNNVVAGDSVAVRVKSRSSMSLCVKVYPNGNINQVIPFCGQFLKVLDTIVGANAGVTYFLISVQSSNNYFGGFEINIDKVNNSPCAQCVQCGTTVYDTIDCPAELKSYRIGVTAGTIIDIAGYASGNNGSPCLELRNSAGQILKRSVCNSSSAKNINFQFPETGCYYLYCSLYNLHYPQQYTINFNVFPGSGTCNTGANCPGCVFPEICNNLIDDDLDGLIDCDDPDCSVHAQITGDTFVCQGLDKIITASGGVSYKWSTGQTTAGINVNFITTTTYTVTVTGAAGCTATASTTVMVIPPFTPGITGATSFCEGGSTVISATPAGMFYHWTTGDSTQSITVTQPGGYGVTITDPYGCSAVTGRQVNKVLNPVAVITGDTIFCPGKSLNLYAAPINLNYLWSTGQTTQSISVNSPGTYSVTVSTANPVCTGTRSKTVHVHPVVTASIASLPVDGMPCRGDTLVLQGNTNAQNAAFKWSGPGNFSALTAQVVFPAILPAQSGLYTLTVTDQQTACTQTASTQVAVQSPLVFVVSGGGSYCAGGAGAPVTLNTSQNGIEYRLYRSGVFTGITVQSPGGAITFGNQTEAGVYTVVAHDPVTGCEAPMNGSATVEILPVPQIFTLTGGGSYCAGGNGMPVGLSGSQIGVNYRLRRNGVNLGSAFPGTGAPLDFGLLGPGVYTVVANNGTPACSASMSGAVEIVVLPLPTGFLVEGGGSFCAGADGVELRLAGSETGVRYYLKRNGTDTGVDQVGTGGPLSFGLQTNPGTYTVLAVSDAWACSATMPGSALVMVNAGPTAEISGNPVVCHDATTTLTATGGVIYHWNTGASGPVLVAPGQDAIYTVTVTDANGCTDIAELQVLADDFSVVTPVEITLHIGDDLQLMATAPGGAHYQWQGPANYASGEQSPVIFNIGIEQAGVYTVTVTDVNGCTATSSTVVSILVKTVAPEVEWGLSIAPNPATSELKLERTPGEQKPLEITLYNAAGLPLDKFRLSSGAASILNVASYSRGIYWLRVTDGTRTGTVRLVLI